MRNKSIKTFAFTPLYGGISEGLSFANFLAWFKSLFKFYLLFLLWAVFRYTSLSFLLREALLSAANSASSIKKHPLKNSKT